MSFAADEYCLLRAALDFGNADARNFTKCDRLLRHALGLNDITDDEVEFALCNSGYEHQRVAKLYDLLRDLVAQGLLEGRGDLQLPAGPRYTECRLSSDGEMHLQAISTTRD
jgi:hypothetical protein